MINGKLKIGDFKRDGQPGSFQHVFIKKMDDGGEICLEACMGGYCVARYDKNQNILKPKTCTNIDGYFDVQIAPGFSMLAGEALNKAVKIANKYLVI